MNVGIVKTDMVCHFYLDCGVGAWLGEFDSNSWCDPFRTWQHAYSFDPIANMTDEQAALVLGGTFSCVIIHHASHSHCTAQVNTFYGRNNPHPPILTPSYGPAPHRPPKFSGQDRDEMLPARYHVCMKSDTVSTSVVSPLSPSSLCGALCAQGPVISNERQLSP